MQSLFLYYMGALLLQFKHLQTGRAHFLILSAVLYGLSLLVYEISLAILPLLVLHLFVLEKSIKATLLKSSLYFLLVASYLGFIFYLRHQYQVTYTGVMPNWDFKKIFATFRNQFYSGFPLSYYLYNPRPEWINLKKYGFESVSTYLSVVSGMFLFYTGLDTTRHQERVKPSRDYIVICLGLAFLPAALIATSSRWQDYIAPGFGYLPVYFTYFGVTGLVALGLTLIFQSDWIRTIPKSIRLVLKATLTLGVGVVLFISHAANIVIAESMDEHYKYPRNLLSHAYENGLASLLKKNSILVTPQSHQWNNKYVSPSVADKIQSVIEISTFQWNSSFPLYYLNFGNASLEQDHQGWAFLSEFTQIDASFQFLNPVIYVETKKNQSGSIQVSCLSKGQPQVVFQSDLPSQKDDFSILAFESFECSLENIRVENKLFGKPKALLEKLFIPR
jgi:hypothetical protein